MAYTPYTPLAAQAGFARNQSRTKLADDLRSSASQRSLQSAQAESMLSNAATNRFQAQTARNQLGVQMRGQDLTAQLGRESIAAETAIKGRALDLAGEELEQSERRIAMEEDKLPFELEALKTANQQTKLQVTGELLDMEMKKAMHAGNMERIPQVFALQDLLMASKTQGFRAEESMKKWATIGRYAGGISDALTSNRMDVATLLKGTMLKEMEDAGFTGPMIETMAQQPLEGNADYYSLMRDTAMVSTEFQQKALLENIKNKTPMMDTVLELMKGMYAQNKDQRAGLKAHAAGVAANKMQIGLILGSGLGLEMTDKGVAKPEQSNDESGNIPAAFNNYLANFTELMPENMSLAEKSKIASALSGNFEVYNETGWGADPEGAWVYPRIGLTEEDGEDELKKILDNKTFPGVSRALTILSDSIEESTVKNMINEAIEGMLKAPNEVIRGRIYEKLALGLSAIQYQASR